MQRRDYHAIIHEIPDSTRRSPAGGPEILYGQSCESAAMASNSWNFRYSQRQTAEVDSSEVMLSSASFIGLSFQLY